MNILFVCSSNICRSPYAEFVFKKIVEENDVLRENVKSVKSAGLITRHKAIFDKTAEALKKEGFPDSEIKEHKPTIVYADKSRFDEADVIIGMSAMHKLFTPKKYRGKFITLSEAALEKQIKIPDPFMMSENKYNDVMDIIKTLLTIYAEKLETEFIC